MTSSISVTGAIGTPSAPIQKECSSCHRRDIVKLKVCALCKKTFYCSVKCQGADWKAHKPLCKTKVKEAPVSSTLQKINTFCPDTTPHWYSQAQTSLNSSRELVGQPTVTQKEFAELVKSAEDNAKAMLLHLEGLKKEGKIQECENYRKRFQEYMQKSYCEELQAVAAFRPGAETTYKEIVDQGIESIKGR